MDIIPKSMATTFKDAAALDLVSLRAQFPSLSQTVNGHPAVFLDGPGGTQVPQRVIDAISDYLKFSNANTNGAYATSHRTNAVIDGARAAMADLFNSDPDEVVFGPNMTTLTYAVSRAMGRELKAGDEILLTHLDHDANVSPWLALEEMGVKIQRAEIHESDCTLDMDDLARKITPRTKLVAVGYASNAVGYHQRRCPNRETCPRERRAGLHRRCPLHATRPHRCTRDRLRFSGLLKLQILRTAHGDPLRKARAPAAPAALQTARQQRGRPLRWEWGTLNHECIAGITACVDYLADLGRRCAHPRLGAKPYWCLWAIRQHERALAESLIRGLLKIRGLKLYGITDDKRLMPPAVKTTTT